LALTGVVVEGPFDEFSPQNSLCRRLNLRSGGPRKFVELPVRSFFEGHVGEQQSFGSSIDLSHTLA
jgi:hypothetical protein